MSRPNPPRSSILSRVLPLGIVLSMLVLVTQPITAQQGHSPWGPGSSTPASESVLDDWITAAIRPDLQESIASIMPRNLPVYDISVTLEPQAEGGSVPSLTGHLTLTWTNQTDQTIDALPFRLFANGPADDHDAVIVSDVQVYGEPVDAGLSVNDSVLTVPFATPLDPGDVAEIALDFAAFLPIDSTDHFGIFGYETGSGTWALAHWYPVVAGWDPTTGFLLDPPSENGDPIFTDTALYDIRVTTEPGWRVVTTGVEFGETITTDDDLEQRRFVSGPARDFTIVADEDFEVATTEVDGITINSWFNPGQERPGQAVADYAARSVSLFSDLLSPYPFVELDLVPVNMSGAAGCEFSQLIYMGSDFYDDGKYRTAPNSLDFTVAHEVVHQWFYGLVGNNQYAHAFIDEGITNYLSAQVYFEMTHGPEAAAAIVNRDIVQRYDSVVNGGGDVAVDQPTDGFPGGAHEYAFAAYFKAPLGFAAIRDAIGDDAFFGALAAYVDQFVFLVAEPDQLLDAFEQASGQDLGDLWREWFEEAGDLPAP